MGKKKAVDLNVPPLTPVVLGKVQKPKFVALKVFILIALFGALIFYLPEIVPMVDKYLVEWGLKAPENTGNPPIIIPPENKEEDPNKPGNEDNGSTKYVILENPSIDLTKEYGISLTDIAYSEGVLTFNVLSSEAASDLSSKNLYVTVYAADDIAVEYIKLMGTATKDTPVPYSINTTGALKISVQVMSEKDYPLYDISVDEKGNSSFVCKKNNETIGYTFLSDELMKIDYSISIPKTDPKYDELYTKYNELYITQKTMKGVTASFKTTTDELKYNVTIDYATAAGSLDFDRFYLKGTKANLIMFELKSEQYNCN